MANVAVVYEARCDCDEEGYTSPPELFTSRAAAQAWIDEHGCLWIDEEYGVDFRQDSADNVAQGGGPYYSWRITERKVIDA